MYNENNNNEQNNGYTNNGHPQEYYYSTGSQNYQNNTPNRKPKKQHPFAKKAVSFVCLGALFGVTAGTAFSVPTYMTNKQLLQTKAQLEQAQSEAAASTPTLSTTTSSLTTSNSNSTASALSLIHI